MNCNIEFDDFSDLLTNHLYFEEKEHLMLDQGEMIVFPNSGHFQELDYCYIYNISTIQIHGSEIRTSQQLTYHQ